MSQEPSDTSAREIILTLPNIIAILSSDRITTNIIHCQNILFLFRYASYVTAGFRSNGKSKAALNINDVHSQKHSVTITPSYECSVLSFKQEMKMLTEIRRLNFDRPALAACQLDQ